jgi:hypothetical protein
MRVEARHDHIYNGWWMSFAFFNSVLKWNYSCFLKYFLLLFRNILK